MNRRWNRLRWSLGVTLTLACAVLTLRVSSQSNFQVGYATLTVEGGQSLPVASALFSYRNAQGILVAEAGVEAVAPIRQGRLFVDGLIPTGLALANPSGETVVATLTLRDAAGEEISQSNLTLGPYEHAARFVTEPEIFGPLPADFLGSLSFETSGGEGLAPLTIRQGTNRFSEPLFATLPVVNLESAAGPGSIIFPHLGAGLGLTTQILLINPSGQSIRGKIELTSSEGTPLELELDGVAGSSFDYELPAHGVFRGTLTAATGVRAGYAQVTSDGPAPAGTAIFQFRAADGSLISEAGVGAARTTSSARIFVDNYQTQTGVALAVPGAGSARVSFKLASLSGASVGETLRDVPPGGHLSVFVSNLFPDLPDGFKGVLTISSQRTFSAVTLKLTINGRGDPILTTLPVATESPGGQRLILPQVGFGLGFSTQLVLIDALGGGQLEGILAFVQSNGSELVTKLAGEVGSQFAWLVASEGAVQLRPGSAAEPLQILLDPSGGELPEVVVNQGSSIPLRPVVIDENGELRNDFPVNFFSLDEQSAQVDGAGMISGNQEGFSTLTVRVGNLVETTTVTVVKVTKGASGFAVSGISQDPAGGLFLSNPTNSTILRAQTLLDTPQVYAGIGGQRGLRNDLKLQSLFRSPRSVALNRADGSLYVADRDNHVIRRIPLSGTGKVETVAGNGQADSRDGIGPEARFRSPSGVALDGSGNLWVADTGNHTIRRIHLDTGLVETIAGLAGQRGASDGVGPAARFDGPIGISTRREPLAVQLQRELSGEAPPLQQIVVADSNNDAIRLVSADGTTSTVFIRRPEGPLSAGGTGRLPRGEVGGGLNGPMGVAGDSSGNLYVSDSSGQVSTVLPDGTLVPAAQDGTFDQPGDVTVTEGGRVVVADAQNTGQELVYGAPDITSIAPEQVSQGGGEVVTLTGRNFAPETIVLLAGRILDGAQAVDTSTIIFTMPPTPSGLKTVTVQNRGGLDQVALDVPPPQLDDLQPGDITTVVGGGDFTGDGLIANEANLGTPLGVTIDSSGNLFVADLLNHRIRRIDVETGIITSVAGTGEPGRAENGGLAIASKLESPWAVRFDRSGNLLFVDNGSRRILRVDAETQIITTVAGSFRGFGGDGGPATEAQLEFPSDFDFDSYGNIAIGDGPRIRRVDVQTGIITTWAGTGVEGCAEDGDLLSEAQFTTPWTVAFDPDNNLFISDLLCGRILRIEPGAATLSVFAERLQPAGMDFDAEGKLVVVDRSVIRRFDRSTGESEHIAGTFDGFAGDGGPALEAAFRFPRTLVIDSAGNIFVSDTANLRIRKIDGETGIVTTIAGRDGTIGDGGQAPNAVLETPIDIQFDHLGNLFVSDHLDYRIRKVDTTQQITTVPSSVEREVSQLTLDPQGNLVISAGRWSIHRIDLQTGEWSTIAGGGTPNCFTEDGEIALGASFGYLGGIAYDQGGNLYYYERPSPGQPCEANQMVITGKHSRVRRIDAVSGRLQTVVGTGEPGFSGDGGPAVEARIDYSPALAFDSRQNLLILELENHRLRRVDAQTGIITTIAGGGSEAVVDGLEATQAFLFEPRGLALDQHDRVYIATVDRILRLDPQTGQLSIVAGSGSRGQEGDGGPAREAGMTFLSGIKFDVQHNLFVVDSQRVRAIKGPLP